MKQNASVTYIRLLKAQVGCLFNYDGSEQRLLMHAFTTRKPETLEPELTHDADPPSMTHACLTFNERKGLNSHILCILLKYFDAQSCSQLKFS